MLLTNCWYALGWSEEFGTAPVAKMILDQRVVVYRTSSGAIAALHDRCPHRGAPLSLGTVDGERLRCGYHGLGFEADGNCSLVPGQERIPPGLTVRAYTTAERWGLVWGWFGQQHLADEHLIPNLHWLTDSEWCPVKGSFNLRAGHELLLDNLQDHTHLQFVHRNTIGTDGISDVKPRFERVGDEVHVTRWLFDRAAPPLFAKAGGFRTHVDRWFNSVFQPPTTIVLDIGCAPVGQDAFNGNRAGGIEIRSLHIITPATENSTHYLWAYVRNFKIGDPEISDLLLNGAKATFEEDVAMLEAQQANLSAEPLPLTEIAIDGSPRLVRRVREELHARAPQMADVVQQLV
jgi:phenylpropionate dioxygenase-like ring-hydroxylating dioxygenase large terminal subunit